MTSKAHLNEKSSRSHLIIKVIVNVTDEKGVQISQGSLGFIDLAGTERTHKSNPPEKQLRKEPKQILVCFFYRKLVSEIKKKPKLKISYNENILTRFIKKYLQTDSKSFFILHVSSDHEHYYPTLDTLNF